MYWISLVLSILIFIIFKFKYKYKNIYKYIILITFLIIYVNNIILYVNTFEYGLEDKNNNSNIVISVIITNIYLHLYFQ